MASIRFGRWVRGDGAGCGEDPAAGEAARGGALQDRGAQEQVRGWAARPPPVRLQHLRGNRRHGRALRFRPFLLLIVRAELQSQEGVFFYVESKGS